MDCTVWVIQDRDAVFGSDIGHDVLVEELQDQRDAVGKHQMLGHSQLNPPIQLK